MADRGEAHTQRQDDRGGPAIHPDGRDGRFVPADPRGVGHRVSGRADPVCDRNGRIAREYVVHYTNAAFVIQEGFKLPEDGLFSGFDAQTGAYDRNSWNYDFGAAGRGQAPQFDPTLENPRCVFQLLKQHYSRYTPEMVERITGIPRDQFLKAADLFTSIRKDGDMKKAATIIYAVGWTQHSSATQTIRAAAILQLLLGNVGRAGGGVNALRGHSNIQGATDMAGVFDILPGYLKMPTPADT